MLFSTIARLFCSLLFNSLLARPELGYSLAKLFEYNSGSSSKSGGSGGNGEERRRERCKVRGYALDIAVDVSLSSIAEMAKLLAFI